MACCLSVKPLLNSDFYAKNEIKSYLGFSLRLMLWPQKTSLQHTVKDFLKFKSDVWGIPKTRTPEMKYAVGTILSLKLANDLQCVVVGWGKGAKTFDNDRQSQITPKTQYFILTAFNPRVSIADEGAIL